MRITSLSKKIIFAHGHYVTFFFSLLLRIHKNRTTENPTSKLSFEVIGGQTSRDYYRQLYEMAFAAAIMPSTFPKQLNKYCT